MSRVKIKELYWEIQNKCNYAEDAWKEYKDIEVVPRKIVEMIIEKCKEIDSRYTTDDNFANSYYSGRRQSAYELQEYTESLLKYFEEDKE